MLTFKDFRDGPARDLLRRIGVDISKCETWDEFTAYVVKVNDAFNADEGKCGLVVKRAVALYPVLSTGERVLMEAVLHAADFTRIATELADGETWRNLNFTYGTFAEAVAAVIVRID